MKQASDRVYRVLFLCTGNSARSIIAESVLNARGKGRFKAFSAGSHPGSAVYPLVLEFLNANGINAHAARSKSWNEFATRDAPEMDFVITVCDQAAGEVCPTWPGRPVVAHWSAPDPALYMSDPERARQVIREIFHLMEWRISLLTSLPVEKLDHLAPEARMRAIADEQPGTPAPT